MLVLKGISKAFQRHGEEPVVAIRGLSAEFVDGEFCVVVGNNGSGKSTLLRIIAGALEPDSGEMSWEGRDLLALQRHERGSLSAMVHQSPSDGTAGTLTIEENLALAGVRPPRARLRRLVNTSRKQVVAGVLRELGMGLDGREGELVRNLSGGQRQALALYMAVLREPRILLLDEHTASLDPHRAEAVRQLTLRLWQERQFTVLMVTHSLTEAMTLGNRLICLNGGDVVFDVRGRKKDELTSESLLQELKSGRAKGFVPDTSFL